MLQSAFHLFPSSPSHIIPSSTTIPFCLSLPFTSPFLLHHSRWQLHQPIKKKKQQFLSFCSSYDVGGGRLDEELLQDGRRRTDEEWNDKLDSSHYEALLKGGEQVTSVLQEMITLLEDMEMDEESEKVAVELAAQGVIGKRVDEMESGFMMALDYMIQLAEKDQDEKAFFLHFDSQFCYRYECIFFIRKATTSLSKYV